MIGEIAIIAPINEDPSDRRSFFRAVLVLGGDEFRGDMIFDVEEVSTGLEYPASSRHLITVDQWERMGSPTLFNPADGHVDIHNPNLSN